MIKKNLALSLIFSFLFPFLVFGYQENINSNETEKSFQCTIPCGWPTEKIRIPMGGRFGDVRTRTDSEGNTYTAKHIGLDISNFCGEPIWAQADGIVTEVNYDNSRGHYVVINHGEYETWYAHLQKVLVKNGLPVEKREIIGRVGETGYAGGCHLHYEIWKNQEPIDPEPFADIEEEEIGKKAWECDSMRYHTEKLVCDEKEIRPIPEDRAENHFSKLEEKGKFPEEGIDIHDLREKINLIAKLSYELKEGKPSFKEDIDLLSKMLNDLQGEVTVQKQRSSFFNRNLTVGDRGEDVRVLQKELNSRGYQVANFGPGSSGNETDYFGSLTKAAIIKFQEASASQILYPLGLTSGTGFFGSATRSLLNSLLTR